LEENQLGESISLKVSLRENQLRGSLRENQLRGSLRESQSLKQLRENQRESLNVSKTEN
jgi:hypothetical protein